MLQLRAAEPSSRIVNRRIGFNTLAATHWPRQRQHRPSLLPGALLPHRPPAVHQRGPDRAGSWRCQLLRLRRQQPAQFHRSVRPRQGSVLCGRRCIGRGGEFQRRVRRYPDVGARAHLRIRCPKRHGSDSTTLAGDSWATHHWCAGCRESEMLLGVHEWPSSRSGRCNRDRGSWSCSGSSTWRLPKHGQIPSRRVRPARRRSSISDRGQVDRENYWPGPYRPLERRATVASWQRLSPDFKSDASMGAGTSSGRSLRCDMGSLQKLSARGKRTSRRQQRVPVTPLRSTSTRTKRGTCSTGNDGRSLKSQTIALRMSCSRRSSKASGGNSWKSLNELLAFYEVTHRQLWR